MLANIPLELRPLVNVRGHLFDPTSGRSPAVTPGTLEATALVSESVTSGDYLMKIYHPTKAEIKADGTFTLLVAVGHNSFYIADYQNYQPVRPGTRQELLDQFLNLDIKAEQQPEIVFRVRRIDP